MACLVRSSADRVMDRHGIWGYFSWSSFWRRDYPSCLQNPLVSIGFFWFLAFGLSHLPLFYYFGTKSVTCLQLSKLARLKKRDFEFNKRQRIRLRRQQVVEAVLEWVLKISTLYEQKVLPVFLTICSQKGVFDFWKRRENVPTCRFSVKDLLLTDYLFIVEIRKVCQNKTILGNK